MAFRKAIKECVQHRREEQTTLPDKVNSVREDVRYFPHHIFGSHSMCRTRGYTCPHTDDEDERDNLVPDLQQRGAFPLIVKALERLRCNVESLLYGVNNNTAEAFNAILVMALGGKRRDQSALGQIAKNLAKTQKHKIYR